MPAVVTEEFVNVAWAVQWRDMVEVDPQDGKVIHNGKGEPKTSRQAMLVFQERDQSRTLLFPLSDDARRKLVEQLTGGIAIPDLKLQT